MTSAAPDIDRAAPEPYRLGTSPERGGGRRTDTRPGGTRRRAVRFPACGRRCPRHNVPVWLSPRPAPRASLDNCSQSAGSARGPGLGGTA
jgi:hypothetical protein